MPAPMPFDAPVTTATLPVSFPISAPQYDPCRTLLIRLRSFGQRLDPGCARCYLGDCDRHASDRAALASTAAARRCRADTTPLSPMGDGQVPQQSDSLAVPPGWSVYLLSRCRVARSRAWAAVALDLETAAISGRAYWIHRPDLQGWARHSRILVGTTLARPRPDDGGGDR